MADFYKQIIKTLMFSSLATAGARRAPALTKSFVPAATAQFSAAAQMSSDKQTLFQELISEAAEIEDYNYKSYFVRRATEDSAKMDDFSVEHLQERLEQMRRIRIVQNLYAIGMSPVERA